eukprot:TRINITY_DN6952_c0_g1_i1.p1 TRINITY_DN6952_c0_g1~~TRINITY_DN6952_c0_g1_i1.p1  ORF type:complete len:429 (-),score=88.17 TRINITY_DN6952_c0_g1_i1:1167-2453(-)
MTEEELIQNIFFFQAEDGIRDHAQSRGLGDVYKRQVHGHFTKTESLGTQKNDFLNGNVNGEKDQKALPPLTMIKKKNETHIDLSGFKVINFDGIPILDEFRNPREQLMEIDEEDVNEANAKALEELNDSVFDSNNNGNINHMQRGNNNERLKKSDPKDYVNARDVGVSNVHYTNNTKRRYLSTPKPVDQQHNTNHNIININSNNGSNFYPPHPAHNGAGASSSNHHVGKGRDQEDENSPQSIKKISDKINALIQEQRNATFQTVNEMKRTFYNNGNANYANMNSNFPQAYGMGNTRTDWRMNDHMSRRMDPSPDILERSTRYNNFADMRGNDMISKNGSNFGQRQYEHESSSTLKQMQNMNSNRTTEQNFYRKTLKQSQNMLSDSGMHESNIRKNEDSDNREKKFRISKYKGGFRQTHNSKFKDHDRD